MRADDQIKQAQSAMLSMGRLSQMVSAAVQESLGADLAGSGPVVTLVALDLRGPLRPGELQELTGLTSGGVSKLLDRLEHLGLVTRSYGALPEDRRGAVVRLTPKGVRAARQVARALIRHLDDLSVAVRELDGLLGGP